MKPKHRSRARIWLGSYYFKLKRYLKWYFGKAKFAKQFDYVLQRYSVFKHQTPILRKLKDVDMWLQHNKKNKLDDCC